MLKLFLILLIFPSMTFAQQPTGDKEATLSKPNAPTKKKALYELGVGVAYVHGPDYPGSDQSRWNGIALPYFAYRGKFLRADREEGMRAMFAETKKWDFDLSFSAAFPANSEDNNAREGMNDLDWIGEIGPQLSYYFIRTPVHFMRLQLPYRFVSSTDFRTWVDRGEVFQPVYRYSYRRVWDSRVIFSMVMGAWWASRRMNEYFYEVDPEFVTGQRPQYGAKAGYVGAFGGVGALVMATEKLWLFLGGSYSDYNGSANEGSPLFRRKSSVSIAMGFIWSLYESKAREKTRYRSFAP